MKERGEPFSCLTCYDATTARWLDRAGVHLLLVGDTAAEVILGFESTVHMPLEVAIALTAGVCVAAAISTGGTFDCAKIVKDQSLCVQKKKKKKKAE